MNKQLSFRRSQLARAVSIASLPIMGLVAPVGIAQGDGMLRLEEVVVTASRRSESVQDIPINISAVSGDQIEKLRLVGINEVARYVPGLTVVDRGPRDEFVDILIRGLNTTQLGPGYLTDTVAVYFGDIPVDLDVNPVDLERVEVLIGPQGTLYGQGTMGGAIRYIPRRADASEGFTADVRAGISQYGESDGFNRDLGVTLNIPIVENVLALRANIDRSWDAGFIDYNFVVRESGVSNPQPDFNNPDDVAANLRQVEDANGADSTSIRINLRWTPTDWLDANLWYLNQDTEAEGRQLVHRLAFGTRPFESALRYEEPNEYESELISLEVKADLGFAELSAVYGETEFERLGQRDQTDLLLDFEYGYEFFPTFSAFTREEDEQETKTFELRLVSQYEGPITWVLGYFYNEDDSFRVSQEFTPGFDQFAVDNFGGVQLRPDSLEYHEVFDVYEEETAFYGEIAYRFADRFEATLGFRRYEFEVDAIGGADTPLFRTVFLGDPPDSIDPPLGGNKGDDDGHLIKVNLAYDIDDDNMVYATYSEGYRNGGLNPIPQCTQEQNDSGSQQLCLQADEVFIDPDEIENYEIGYKGRLLDGRLAVSAALYLIDWTDLQVATTSKLGSLPILGNGSAAESKGFEFQGNFLIDENWSVALTYAYTNAELTDDAPGIVGEFDVLSGARLPGHAEHQGSLNVTYSTEVGNGIELDVNYGIVYSGDIYNILGGDQDPLTDPNNGGAPADRGGEAIPSYDIHHLSATFQRDQWSIQAFIENIWDEYYITGTRTTRRFLQNEQTGPGNTVNGFSLRNYGQYVGSPRTAGVKVTYSF